MNERIARFLDKNKKWMGHDTSVRNAQKVLADGTLRSALDVLLKRGELEYEAGSNGTREVSDMWIHRPDYYGPGTAEGFMYRPSNSDLQLDVKERVFKRFQRLPTSEVYSIFGHLLPEYEKALQTYAKGRLEHNLGLWKNASFEENVKTTMDDTEIQLFQFALGNRPRPTNRIYGWDRSISDGSGEYGSVTIMVPEPANGRMFPDRYGIGSACRIKPKYDERVVLPTVPICDTVVIANASDLRHLESNGLTDQFVARENLSSDDLLALNVQNGNIQAGRLMFPNMFAQKQEVGR